MSLLVNQLEPDTHSTMGSSIGELAGVFSFVSFGATSCGAHRFLLALHSGITMGGT